ncbi:MAG: type II toxin-antitoxin system RelE/ParE family toxin [Pseudomonas sp.]
MFTVHTTDVFDAWFSGLRDARAKARIEARIRRAELGNLGDAKFFDGIGEMRIDYGPGYRLYLLQSGLAVYLLLCGGDKSTQDDDIKTAQRLARELRKQP